MSRIGRLPIQVPAGVKVSVAEGLITVEGPKGKLTQSFAPQITVTENNNVITVERKDDLRETRAYHGLYRSLIKNMVKGVSEGFSKTLIITGVGYKAEVAGKELLLSLGYSTQIQYQIADGLQIKVDGPNKIIVSGIDKQLVGQTCVEIKSLRPVEPYKGKGIKFENEFVRRKVGKSGTK
ncbi:MAG: 50S ribosomal protein L6 [Spirochaetia bacterium]|nr:50S ribosomal protein L6 [Spirochaetia bacterium]